MPCVFLIVGGRKSDHTLIGNGAKVSDVLLFMAPFARAPLVQVIVPVMGRAT